MYTISHSPADTLHSPVYHTAYSATATATVYSATATATAYSATATATVYNTLVLLSYTV